MEFTISPSQLQNALQTGGRQELARVTEKVRQYVDARIVALHEELTTGVRKSGALFEIGIAWEVSGRSRMMDQAVVAVCSGLVAAGYNATSGYEESDLEDSNSYWYINIGIS